MSTDIKNAIVACGTRPERVTVVLNGVDPDRFKRNPDLRPQARAHFEIPSDAVAVGAVGRLEPEKNFSMLIRAFARVRGRFSDAVLLIAGGGSLQARLAAEAAAAGLSPSHFRLLGLIDQVPLLHHALDVYVQSSDEEGTANAVLEAMALETPIVATDVGGTAEVARHGIDALIVPRGDEDATVTAMMDVLGDPAGARARAASGRVRVETELSFELRTRRVEAVYDAVAARAGVSLHPTRVHA